MHNRGMVNSEKSVDKNIIFTANCSSPSYLDARMAVVAPAGIPESTTHTEVTSTSSEKTRHPANTSSGNTIRRIKQ